MPKPILSDSLFNATDVAEAIVDTIDLGVVNSNLAVVDRSSLFVLNSSYSHSVVQAYSFNGFMFVQLNCDKTTTANHLDVVYTISDSDFYPISLFTTPSSGYQGDSVASLRFETNGEIRLDTPTNTGHSNFYINATGFYRFS